MNNATDAGDHKRGADPIEEAWADSFADIAAGRYVIESVEAHLRRLSDLEREAPDDSKRGE